MALSYMKIYLDTIEELNILTDEEVGRLFKYLLIYANTGVEPTIEGNERYLFPVFKKQHDREVKAYEATCEKRRVAGKAGGETKRDNKQKKDANATEPQEEEVKEPKKTKKEAVSKNKYAEFVTMTEEEYAKLMKEHGEQATQGFITRLDNYKGSSGTNYKSDYRAILSWVIDSVKKANPKQPYQQNLNQPIDPNINPYG